MRFPLPDLDQVEDDDVPTALAQEAEPVEITDESERKEGKSGKDEVGGDGADLDAEDDFADEDEDDQAP